MLSAPQFRRHPERSRFSGGAKDLARIAMVHVGTAAPGCPVERSSTAIFAESRHKSGCPILARSVRKRGNTRSRHYGIFALATLFVVTSACRLDMHVQPRQNPLARSDFFADQRSARPPVEGTIARGQLREDAYFYTGKIGNNPGDMMPFPVTKEVLERGRERYNIYCAPCHSRIGDGNGFVPSRGFARKPPTFHKEKWQKMPLGYFFDVITNGFGTMPDYASQVSTQDRWDIVAYIRALQLSQNATMADVPAGQKIPSEPPNFKRPGSGATLPVIAPESKSEDEKKMDSHKEDTK